MKRSIVAWHDPNFGVRLQEYMQAIETAIPPNAWPEFYDYVVDVLRHAFSWPMITKRLVLNRGWLHKWFHFVRSVSSEGFGRIAYHTKIRQLLDTNIAVRQFIEGETNELPNFYHKKIRGKLGPLWDMLPAGAVRHDHQAYLHSQTPPPIMPPARSAASPF